MLKVKNKTLGWLMVAAGARRTAALQCLTKRMIYRQFDNHLEG